MSGLVAIEKVHEEDDEVQGFFVQAQTSHDSTKSFTYFQICGNQ
jgi:hypothetical protein